MNGQGQCGFCWYPEQGEVRGKPCCMDKDCIETAISEDEYIPDNQSEGE